MRALLLVLFCTVALQWDRVSCQKTVYQSNTHVVLRRNVWRSDRPAEVTQNRNGDEVSWTKLSEMCDHAMFRLPVLS